MKGSALMSAWLLWATAWSGLATPVPIIWAAGTPRVRDASAGVALTRESVLIEPEAKTARVRVICEFLNQGGAREVRLGYPAMNIVGPSDLARVVQAPLRVQGTVHLTQPVPGTTEYKGQTRPCVWHEASVRLPAMAAREVRLEYEVSREDDADHVRWAYLPAPGPSRRMRVEVRLDPERLADPGLWALRAGERFLPLTWDGNSLVWEDSASGEIFPVLRLEGLLEPLRFGIPGARGRQSYPRGTVLQWHVGRMLVEATALAHLCRAQLTPRPGGEQYVVLSRGRNQTTLPAWTYVLPGETRSWLFVDGETALDALGVQAPLVPWMGAAPQARTLPLTPLGLAIGAAAFLSLAVILARLFWPSRRKSAGSE